MKKLLLAALALSCAAGLQAKLELVSVDSMVLLEKSKAGQELANKARKERESLESFIATTNKELAQLQEEISTKAQLLSKEALQEKMDQFEQRRRRAEREITDKREAASLAIQREQSKFREEQLGVIKKMCERKGWDALLEKNAALFVSNSIDKTADVLQELDAAHDAKSGSAKADVKKKAQSVKREIKVA